MPDQDHQFRRIEKESNQEQAKKDATAKIEDKLKQFQWDDAEEEVEGEELVVSDEVVNECVSLLSAHLLSHIIGEHFGNMDTSGMQFVIPVDLDLHVLLRKRYEEEWSLDSRLDMFQSLREKLVAEFREKKVELDAKIQEALPSTYRKKFTSGEVSLEDDAMIVDEESNMISIEIPVHFEAN